MKLDSWREVEMEENWKFSTLQMTQAQYLGGPNKHITFTPPFIQNDTWLLGKKWRWNKTQSWPPFKWQKENI